MKSIKSAGQMSHFKTDSQNRLLAYTTAAGFGAFFAGQHVEGQVTASAALAPYPHTLIKGAGAGVYKTYFYLDVDGDGTPDFLLNIDTYRIKFGKAINSETNNTALNPSSNGYVIPWTVGTTLNSTNGSVWTYQKWLASSVFYNGSWAYLFNDFPTEEALGFSFTAKDSLTHFGYMNIQINHTAGANNDFTATVTGIYYNATPNAGIVIGALPPASVKVTSIQVGAAKSVTIDFTSSDNAPTSAFTLQSSPALGASASWTTDSAAVITSSGPGVYQAVTTGTGGSSQFFRISH